MKILETLTRNELNNLIKDLPESERNSSIEIFTLDGNNKPQYSINIDSNKKVESLNKLSKGQEIKLSIKES